MSTSDLKGAEAKGVALDAGDLAASFRDVRSRTTALVEPLSAEDCAAQSMEDASPAKWHLAHTTWFFETFVLEAFDPDYRAFDPSFRVLFNSYYNAVGEQYPRPRRGMLTRPGLSEVLRYRESVDSRLLRELEAGALPEETRGIVELGLHHEQQHQELILTDVLHLLFGNPQRPAYRRDLDTAPACDPAPMTWHRGAEGIQTVGHHGVGFGFDNEGPRHKLLVSPHEISSRLVNNSEYLEFIEDGGYARPELWLSEGWAHREREGWMAPLYWESGDEGWQRFGLGGREAVVPSEPVVHVSLFEADAYARWAGARLPLESEWELAAGAPTAQDNLLERGRLGPSAAPAREPAAPGQFFGDAWEWTGSSYHAYPGYRPTQGALGEYNGKFMSNQYVLRGGSCVTPRDHIRASYRNFFPAHARWQWSGLRLARDA